MLTIDHLDHIVLTVADIDATIAFYTGVLGMTAVTFAGGRRALTFGPQKINLHRAGHEFSPCARRPTAGSADFCLITKTPLDAAMAHVQDCGVTIEEGPVDRTGAIGTLRSFYFRDPDGNLVEISNYVDAA